MEKFRGFRGLTGDRETFPVKDFPTGNFFKNGRRHYTGERGIAIPMQLHECWIQLLWATINNVSCVECYDACMPLTEGDKLPLYSPVNRRQRRVLNRSRPLFPVLFCGADNHLLVKLCTWPCASGHTSLVSLSSTINKSRHLL